MLKIFSLATFGLKNEVLDMEKLSLSSASNINHFFLSLDVTGSWHPSVFSLGAVGQLTCPLTPRKHMS